MKLPLLSLVLLMSQLSLAADPVPLLQEVLSDGKRIYANSIGQTLYVFDPDQAAGKPTCAATCAEKWPPYLVTEEEATQLSGGFGTVKRENGLLQITIRGRPVYLFHLDRTPADTKGDGLGGVWHVSVPQE